MFAVASPTRQEPIRKATTRKWLSTKAAGIRRRPERKAMVIIPFRVRVSSQPRRTKLSAIQPPTGWLTPKTRKGKAAR